MSIKVLTGIALATALATTSVQAANYLPEEPYADFAIGQEVQSDEGAMMTDKAMMRRDHSEGFWGWSVDEPLK